jgi:hypothetical protein
MCSDKCGKSDFHRKIDDTLMDSRNPILVISNDHGRDVYQQGSKWLGCWMIYHICWSCGGVWLGCEMRACKKLAAYERGLFYVPEQV